MKVGEQEVLVHLVANLTDTGSQLKLNFVSLSNLIRKVVILDALDIACV